MDFESPDDIETKYRRSTPVKAYTGFRQEADQQGSSTPVPEEAATASGSESDYYENNTGENADRYVLICS